MSCHTKKGGTNCTRLAKPTPQVDRKHELGLDDVIGGILNAKSNEQSQQKNQGCQNGATIKTDSTDPKKELLEVRWDRADFLRAASAVSGTHSQIHQGSSDRKHHAASRPHIDRLAACDFVHAAMGDGFFARIADHNEQDCVGKE